MARLAKIQALLARARAWAFLNGRIRLMQPWVLLLGPVLLLGALVVPYRWLFFIGYAYLLLVLAGYLWVRTIGPRVGLQRRLRAEWVQVGDTLEEQWQLRNDAPLPLLWLEVEDNSTLPNYSGRRVAAAWIYDRYAWSTRARCTRRGVYTLGPLLARLGDPFGLFVFEWHQPSAHQIVIYPPLVRLPPLLLPKGQRGGLTRADLQQQYVTPSVGGLREYVPGDLLSHIHWPTVARTQQLMVKEFDQERAGALWIALDLSAEAYPRHQQRQLRDPVEAVDVYDTHAQSSLVDGAATINTAATALELAIVLACSLAAQALAEGRAVGLLANDGRRRLLTPGRGPRQLWRVLSELVDAEARGALSLADLLREGRTAHANEIAGAGVVVITPALDGEWLPALAAWLRGKPGGALAFLVADEPARAQPLTTQLAASGILTQVFEVGVSLPLLNPPRTDQTTRVSPFGKVVTR